MVANKYKAGWHGESYRHALAAKGIKTGKNYFSSKSFHRYFRQRDDQFINLQDVGVKDTTEEEFERQDRVAEQTQDVLSKTGVPGQASPATQRRRLVEGLKLDADVEETIRSARPVEQAIDRANQGDVSRALQMLANRQGTTDEQEALRTALNNFAVQQANAGVPVPDGVMEQIDSSVKKNVENIERQRALAGESAFKKTLRGTARDAAVGAIESPLVAADSVLSATGAGISAIADASREGQQELSKGRGPGVVGNIDALGNTPFFANNALGAANERKSGALATMQPVPSAINTWDFLPDDGQPTNLAFKAQQMANQPTYTDQVSKKIDSYFDNKREFTQVDFSPFREGTKAFKSGNREKLIESIAKLENEESKLRDRWNLVSKAHAQQMSNENHEAAFKDKGTGTLWFLSKKGAEQLKDQTEKINDVRSELIKTNNKLASRRQMLQYRLQRMDATVPAETDVPEKVMRFREEDAPFSLFSFDTNPIFNQPKTKKSVNGEIQ